MADNINKNMEILAPAGGYESLESALRCGANAVYAGGRYFSARGNAKNFSDEELKKACELCHLYGAKFYLAVNTIISDSETEAFCSYIKYTSEIGIDAYIVQDFGCVYLIKKCVPDSIIHASTQMTIHTLKGAEFAGSLGFSRIVPARELSGKEIKEICKSGLETEVFVHGALCMSVSGQCYMSAMIGSRSANRGICGQACRLPFTSCGNKNFCGLSLKDLSVLEHINTLKEYGVDSLKIEGRMKRPEYTASAVNETKKAIEGKKPDMKLLENVFSRSGFTDGYFTGNLNNMFGTRLKDNVTSASDVFPDIRELYRKNPKIYSLKFSIIIKENQNIKITALLYNKNKSQGISATITGDIPEKALKRPIYSDFIEKQLSKLGDTIFEYAGCETVLGENLMVTASSLNSLRRNIVEKISELIIKNNTPKYQITEYVPKINKNNPKSVTPEIRFQCRNALQAKIAEKYADMLIIPIDECKKALDLNISPKKICIAPPRFITNENDIINKLRNLKSLDINDILCVNPAYIQIGKELGFILHGGFGLNVSNSFSCIQLAESGLSDLTFSFEMKISQLRKINSPVPAGIIAYGRLPLMLTRNCPIKNETGCSKCKKQISDRTGRVFPVICEKGYNEILNSDILCLEKKDFSGFDFILIMLYNENENQIKNIAENIGHPEFRPESATKGLYYRGII